MCEPNFRQYSSNSSWDILLKSTNMNLQVALGEKVTKVRRIYPLVTMNICTKYHDNRIVVEIFQSGPSQTSISIHRATLLAWLTMMKTILSCRPCGLACVCVSTCIRWRAIGRVWWLVQRRTGSGTRGDGLQFIKHMRLTAAELRVVWCCCATASCNSTEWVYHVMMLTQWWWGIDVTLMMLVGTVVCFIRK